MKMRRLLIIVSLTLTAAIFSWGADQGWAQSAPSSSKPALQTQGQVPPAGVKLSKRNKARLEVEAAKVKRNELIKSLLTGEQAGKK